METNILDLLMNLNYVLMELEKWAILAVMSMKVNGKMEKFMEQEHMSGNLDKNIKDNIFKATKKDQVYCILIMIINSQECGKMEKEMELVNV